MRRATASLAMKAMSFWRPLHAGQARMWRAKTFFRRSAQGTRKVRGGSTLLGSSPLAAPRPASATGEAGAGSRRALCFRRCSPCPAGVWHRGADWFIGKQSYTFRRRGGWSGLWRHAFRSASCRLVPQKYIRSHRVFPIALGPGERRGKLFVATSAPQNLAVLDEVAFITGMTSPASR
jgi:hypothetical protein